VKNTTPKSSAADPGPWRAAVIGCGRIGCGFDDDPNRTQVSTHAGAYARTPGVSLVALADLDQAKLDTYGRKFGAAGCYRDYRTLLRDERPDVVSVCTWSGTHAAVVGDAVEAGVKAVFCEKPMADRAADARAMNALCASRGVVLLVNHKRRFSAFHQAVANFLRSARIGVIQQATVYYVSGVANTGSHLFDLLRLYFGEVSWIETRPSHRRSPLADDPNVDGILWFERGFPVLLQACDTASYYVLEIVILGTEGRLRINTGTHEAVEWEEARPSVYASEYRDLVPAAPPIPPVEARPEIMLAGVSHLIACLEHKAMPLCSGLDGLRAVEMFEAVKASAARDGERIVPGAQEITR
jgi:predicted dehydrogenase